MKLLLCYYTNETDIESSEPRANAFFDLVFAKDGKVLASLCSGDAFLMIIKVPIIAGLLKLRKKSVFRLRKLIISMPS